jgi:hypothetical protein
MPREPPDATGDRVGLVVTFVPKVPFWKRRDFKVLRPALCDNALI